MTNQELLEIAEKNPNHVYIINGVPAPSFKLIVKIIEKNGWNWKKEVFENFLHLNPREVKITFEKENNPLEIVSVSELDLSEKERLSYGYSKYPIEYLSGKCFAKFFAVFFTDLEFNENELSITDVNI